MCSTHIFLHYIMVSVLLSTLIYVLSLLKQESCFTNFDGTPLDKEILNAIRKLNISSPGADGIHARLWQALSSTDASFSFIRHFVVQVWITEMPPSEWEIGLLSILPKKAI